VDLERVTPGDVSPLAVEFLRASPSELYRNVIVVRFRGAQRAGADGVLDARFMQAQVALAMDLWSPDGLVVDLSAFTPANPTALKAVLTPVEPNLEEGFPFYVACAAPAALAGAFPEAALAPSLDEALARVARAGPWALR
jgi:hypothetical protein